MAGKQSSKDRKKRKSKQKKDEEKDSGMNMTTIVATIVAGIALFISIVPSSIWLPARSVSVAKEEVYSSLSDFDEVKSLKNDVRRSNLFHSSAFAHCDDTKMMKDCIQQVIRQRDGETLEEVDPDLFPMNYTIFNSDGSIELGSTLVYKRPHISTFYNNKDSQEIVERRPNFIGKAAKFFNLSPYTVELYWEGSSRVLMDTMQPYQSHGMGSFPNHKFVLIRKDGYSETVLKTFSVDPNNPLNVYNSIEEGHLKLEDLPDEYQDLHFQQLTNIEFAKKYKEFTGIEWLATFPKARPRYPLWRADFFGQKHSVVTKESQFVVKPPWSLLPDIKYRVYRASQVMKKMINPLDSFRTGGSLTLNITVLSCAPRVFEVKNFLSEVEVEHILEVAASYSMTESTVEGGSHKATKIRTSKNAWIDRSASPILDAVYRRAADLMRIDESLLRYRSEEEKDISDSINSQHGIAESLQMVHYDVGQEYTPHHDFRYPDVKDAYQSARFATILLYLNEGMVGGETTFPRFRNGETSDELHVTPEIGKAVFFYSTLPDGNYDDLSQHAAKPVRNGEKWLTNLWLWDPKFAL